MAEDRTVSRNPSTLEQTWPWTLTFEEYRYDALGRRVMVRTRRQCRGDASSSEAGHPCQHGTLRRTVWDGTQELYEIERPGRDSDVVAEMDNDTLPTIRSQWTGTGFYDANPRFGIVAYTHALGMDRPLAVTRMQYVSHPSGQSRHVYQPFSIMPHWDWRGAASFGTLADASGDFDGADRICRPSQPSVCIRVNWRLRSFAFAQAAPTAPSWNGTLIEDKEDGTGRLYRRNRTVDPATGRFTQEDPIGLAGGLNLYGFASDNPVCLIRIPLVCARLNGHFVAG